MLVMNGDGKEGQAVMSGNPSTDKRLVAARHIASEIGRHLDIDASIRLWDGSRVPLGPNVHGDLAIAINSPGALSALLRWPTLDHLIRQYALGRIGIEGGTLIDLGERLGHSSARRQLRQISKWRLLREALPLLLGKPDRARSTRAFSGEITGETAEQRDETKFIQFHYDVSNDFYALFLDPEMVYSCGYFTDWGNSLAQAQFDKLDMICRKLRLRAGERFLDIGCGWGALVCHAAQHYGVQAVGVTLSQRQFDFAQEKIARLGLSGRVGVRLEDYRDVTGPFDKIASVGMYEHIGVAAYPAYFAKIRKLLAPGGLLLNHGITRGAKKRKARFSRRPEQRALLKYIFPGGELDDIGNTLRVMEAAGLEIHDVEGWREHYALTTRHWCERLTARREEAERIVGSQTYRIWTAYLAGSSLAFMRGSARLYQTLAGRSARGRSPLPPTRADLYR